MIKNFRTIPWLTDGAIEFLTKFFTEKPNATVLEFGAGGSTVWMSKLTKNLTTIEHQEKWYREVSDYIKGHPECNPVDIRRLDLPYRTVCHKFPDEHFDLILVDGRSRVECTHAALPKVKKDGYLMLDNAERADYIGAFQSLCLWEMTRSVQKGPDSVGFGYTNWQTCWWRKPK